MLAVITIISKYYSDYYFLKDFGHWFFFSEMGTKSLSLTVKLNRAILYCLSEVHGFQTAIHDMD